MREKDRDREDRGEEKADGAAEKTPFNGQVAEKSCIQG